MDDNTTLTVVVDALIRLAKASYEQGYRHGTEAAAGGSPEGGNAK